MVSLGGGWKSFLYHRQVVEESAADLSSADVGTATVTWVGVESVLAGVDGTDCARAAALAANRTHSSATSAAPRYWNIATVTASHICAPPAAKLSARALVAGIATDGLAHSSAAAVAAGRRALLIVASRSSVVSATPRVIRRTSVRTNAPSALTIGCRMTLRVASGVSSLVRVARMIREDARSAHACESSRIVVRVQRRILLAGACCVHWSPLVTIGRPLRALLPLCPDGQARLTARLCHPWRRLLR
jgi:hypothetical protein